MSEKSSSRSGAVVLDVDGVLLSFSNRRFYARMILEVGRSLKHLSPDRKNIIENIRAFKKSGAGGLFAYLRNMCRDEVAFENICSNIAGKLDYSKIKPEPELKKHLELLSRNKNVIIRTDGVAEIAGKVFRQLTGDDYKGRNIIISDIRDNGFKTKTDKESWDRFAGKYGIDLSKSVLIDDSKANIKTAAAAGKTAGRHVSRKQPLHDILGGMCRAAVKEHQENVSELQAKAKRVAANTKRWLKKNTGR